MKGRHDRVWQEHEDDDRPLDRPNFAARLIAPLNRLFVGKLGRVLRWFAGTVAALVLCIVGVYVAFLTGLLSVDVATPWIVSALEEKLPPGHKVTIGRTRLDYDSAGAPVLTAEQLEIRNNLDEEIVRAPAAEVGLEAGSLLMGNYRVRRITLRNAVMTVRLDENGNIKVSTPKQLPARAAEPEAKPAPRVQPAPVVPSDPLIFSDVASWLERLERTGIDGIALSEIGLERGVLIVESDTSGKSWNFNNISFSFRRSAAGGATFRLSSGEGARPWDIAATVTPPNDGVRALDLVATRVVPNDLINAAGYGDLDIYASTPVSAVLRATMRADGKLLTGHLSIAANKGEIGNARDERGRFDVDNAQLILRFEPERGIFIIDPLQFTSDQNSVIIGAVIEPPKDGGSLWRFSIPKGRLAVGTGRANEPRLTIDTIEMRGGYDLLTRRFAIDEGLLRGPTAGLALTGALTLGDETPKLQLGLAADRMPVSAFKRLWPAPVAPGARTWVMEHVDNGLVDRVMIALDIPLEALATVDPVLPDSAIKLDVQASNMQFRPVNGLPPITEAKATISVTGQNARIRVTNGVIDLGRKRRLAIPEGTFEVLEHFRHPPTGVVQMKIEGTGEAIAELLSRDLLKGETGIALNPDTTRGNIAGNLRIELPLKRDLLKSEVRYAAEADVTNFAAENIVKGQRIENGSGKITISATHFVVKGEGRIGGAPAVFEYTKPRGKPDADFRINTTLDEAARNRFGIELSPWLSGPVSIRAAGTMNDRESRMNMEADLTASTITELVPGWNKPAGRATRAQFRLIERNGAYKVEDVNVTGSGVNLRGAAEFDSDGAIVSANFPTFQLSEGDRATLSVDRQDGTMRVTLRGTVLDARGMLRSISDTQTAKKKEKPRDIDLDVRIGAATGHNGEVLRNVELRVTRRNGEIRSFALLGRAGRDSSLVGELRARDGGRQVIYLTSGDAGAVFRFADYYSKIQGGEIWIVLDTPTQDNAPQEGIVSVRNFNIVGEPALDRLQSTSPSPSDNTAQRTAPQPRGGSVSFIRMRIDFTRTPGRFTIKEGLIFGPTIGATVDGVLDYANNSVQIRGTYVPAYGLNNIFGQIPLVGLFLGGPKEGLLALTFEIVGPASGPTLRINPMSMAAPGFFRKIFEFRGANDSMAPINPR